MTGGVLPWYKCVNGAKKAIVFTTRLRLYRSAVLVVLATRNHIKMEEKSVWSLDFSDCAPITSPSKQAKVNYVQEENDSSSDEGEDSLVSH